MFTYKEVQKLNKKGNVIPLFEKIPADLDTPVGAYIKLASHHKNSFLLESIEGGEKLARYSFIGFDPFLNIQGESDHVVLSKGKIKKRIDTNPVEFVQQLFDFYKPVRVEGLPRFTGGGVGYFAYDTIRWIEEIPDGNSDDLNTPSMLISMYRNIIVFDHLKQEILVISNILHESGEKGLKKKYDDAARSIIDNVKTLQTKTIKDKPEKILKSNIKADYSQKEYEAMVRKAKKYIKEGDIFQVVLSQRWQIKSKLSSLTCYRRLRRLNPSPYMFLLNFGNTAIVGSSPEMLVRVEGKTIETRPIAGTRPRGKNEIEDLKLIDDLKKDKKELAEHTMLLDLGRNDLGRVCKPGTVEVADQMIIEKYSHVIHLVSSVKGVIEKNVSPIESFFSCFPAGTVSGAPKIRAMEIIDELEKLKRGVYAGAVAYLDFWGNLDSCIAIRTLVKKNDTIYVQAGAGIVADSKPAKEFKETEAKAKVLIKAVTGEG
ncbi:MAG: anthranilate synthase component I [bacterium]